MDCARKWRVTSTVIGRREEHREVDPNSDAKCNGCVKTERVNQVKPTTVAPDPTRERGRIPESTTSDAIGESVDRNTILKFLSTNFAGLDLSAYFYVMATRNHSANKTLDEDWHTPPFRWVRWRRDADPVYLRILRINRMLAQSRRHGSQLPPEVIDGNARSKGPSSESWP